jgi:O-antigen/teichoic acid export membrane protein
MLDQLKKSSSQAIFHLFSNSVIQVFVAFLANIILLRSISPEIFGSFAILVAVIGFIFSILSLRLSIKVINAQSSEYNESFIAKMHSVFFLELLCILVTSLAVLFFTNYFEFWAMVVLLALSTQHFVDYIKSFFERSMSYKSLARVETYTRLFGHFFAITAIYFFPSRGFEILILRELCTATSMLFGLWMINGLIKFSPSFPNFDTFFEIIQKIKNIWFEGVLEQSFTRLTLLSVSYISNPAGVGVFAQAQRLSILLDQFIAPIYVRFSMNWYSRQENFKKRLFALYSLTLSLLVINSFLVIFLYYFIEGIILFLYGEQWVKVANAMFYLYGLIIFRAPFEALKVYCYSQNIVRVIFLARGIQFITLAAAIFGNFEFFGEGINPVSIALSLSYGLGFGLIIVLIPIIEFKNKNI